MPSSDIIIYQKPDGNIKIDVRQEDELVKDVVCRESRQTTQHGAKRLGKPAA